MESANSLPFKKRKFVPSPESPPPSPPTTNVPNTLVDTRQRLPTSHRRPTIQNYGEVCAVLGCSLLRMQPTGYCCLGHRIWSNRDWKMPFRLLGGFDRREDRIDMCCSVIYNMSRDFNSGIPNLQMPDFFKTLPWQQEDKFHPPQENSDWFFFTSLPVRYPQINGCKLKWRSSKGKKPVGHELPTVYHTLYALRNVPGQVENNAEIVGHARFWKLHMFERDTLRLYNLSYSTSNAAEKDEEPTKIPDKSNKIDTRPKPPPSTRRGESSKAAPAAGNEKVASTQRLALSTASGGRVDVAAMSTISGVKATYLLDVAFLEIIRFISNGGILNGDSSVSASTSAFSCVFEYLKTPNLTPAVSQCLTAIVHRAFETAVSWLEERISLTGKDAQDRELTTYAHACFLIKCMSQRDEHVREISMNRLTQLQDKFPQVLWHSACLDSLLCSVHDNTPSTVVNDPAWTAAVRSLYQKVVREWIIISLSYAPCTSQGLLQDKLCKANTWQRAETTTGVVSLLSELTIGTGKNELWSGTRIANIQAVIAVASGANLKVSEAFNVEILGTGNAAGIYVSKIKSGLGQVDQVDKDKQVLVVQLGGIRLLADLDLAVKKPYIADIAPSFLHLLDKLCKANTWQRAETTTDVVSLLSELTIGTGKNELWSGTRTANIQAVIAVASGANLKVSEAFNVEILGTGNAAGIYVSKIKSGSGQVDQDIHVLPKKNHSETSLVDHVLVKENEEYLQALL